MGGPAKPFPSDLFTVAAIFVAMLVLAAIEGVVPFRARPRTCGRRIGINLALTIVTLTSNAALGAILATTLRDLTARHFGLFPRVIRNDALALVVAVIALDLCTWVGHLAMHKLPILWRLHRVHHQDAFVDVTTTLRQHPLEAFVRHAFLAPVACLLGVGVGAFLLYRTASVACALFEHANVRVPRRLARALELVTTFPDLHKIHHSRDATETDSNYGNLFSVFDRIFVTFTSSERARTIRYSLEARVPSP
jgi:sterol desaturase/sphingolipid hydroxylase (fatty acid hydroxylase superfamily)